MTVIVISGKEAFAQAIASGRVLVKFGADGRCATSRAVTAMLPLVERFLDIAVVDVDIEDPANAWCSGRLVDSQTPQFSFYAGGHLIDHKAGFGGYSSLRYWLDDPLGFNGGLPVTTEAESLFALQAEALRQAYRVDRAAISKRFPREALNEGERRRAEQALESSLRSGEIDAAEYEAERRRLKSALEPAVEAVVRSILGDLKDAYSGYLNNLVALCDKFKSDASVPIEEPLYVPPVLGIDGDHLVANLCGRGHHSSIIA